MAEGIASYWGSNNIILLSPFLVSTSTGLFHSQADFPIILSRGLQHTQPHVLVISNIVECLSSGSSCKSPKVPYDWTGLAPCLPLKHSVSKDVYSLIFHDLSPGNGEGQFATDTAWKTGCLHMTILPVEMNSGKVNVC